MLLSDLSVDRISGEGSLRVASRLYCISQWGCNRSGESEGAMACVQDFVRQPLFTQRNFLSETGIRMLNTAVTAAYAVQNSLKFDPWGAPGVEVGPINAVPKLCREKIVSRRKAVKNKRERWFGVETVASSAVGDTAPRTTVRIVDVVEVIDVQYVEARDKLALLCCGRSTSSPEKRKKRRVSVSPEVAKKNSFLLKVPPLAVPHLRPLLRRALRSRVREEVVVIAVMLQFSKVHIINNLILYMYRLLAFEI